MIDRRVFVGGALAGCALPGKPARAHEARDALADLDRSLGARLGVAMHDTASGVRIGYRAEERFPLTSTFKFLAAGAVLAKIDAGRDQFERRVRFEKSDLVAYSPATEKHAGGQGMTLAELCEAAVTLSDNTAGNLLLAAIGGPDGLTRFARTLGDEVTRLDRIEPALNEARPGDLRDTTSPGPKLCVTKTGTLNDVVAGGNTALVADLNETISYVYNVTNCGNVAITNVRINDTHEGALLAPGVVANETLITEGPLGTPASADTVNNGTWNTLQPGALIRFTYTHTVTQTEINGG